MPSWELEIAAEELRRYAPEGWKKFMLALDIEARASLGHILDAPGVETLMQFQGEARALRNLLAKLHNAHDVTMRLKGREDA